MNYTVEWTPLAVNESAAAWLEASDQWSATHALYLLTQSLASAPFGVGRPYGSTVQRIVISEPIGLAFAIVEDDKKVIVQSCWLVG